MANIKLYFRTLNKREEKKESDAQAIAEIVGKYSIDFKYTVFASPLVIFNVLHIDKSDCMTMLSDICTSISSDSRYKSLRFFEYHQI